jgi:hypothetical protein
MLGCLGLLVAGCGEGSGSPSKGGGSMSITQKQKVSSYVTYAACLNKHGVEVQVARTGGLVWDAAPGVPGPRSPQALDAERDCKALVPTGWNQAPSAAQITENLTLMLRYAECIRAHGVPNFPDPTSQGLRIGASSGINVNSPAFRAAEKRCQKYNLTLAAGS